MGRTRPLGQVVLFAGTLVFYLLSCDASGASFRLSFLEEKEVLEDTCRLLGQNGFAEEAVATFRKLVEHHNRSGNRVDKGQFPPCENGYYQFRSVGDLTNRLTYSFCVTPGNDSLEQQTLMCVDVACLLMKGAGCDAPRVEPEFASNRFILLNGSNQVASATYADYQEGLHLLWPPQGYEYFTGKPRSEAETRLAIALRGARRLAPGVSNRRRELRAVFSDYVRMVQRDGFKYPSQFKVGLGFWANPTYGYLEPAHAFICFCKGGRLVCVEKDGCKGPYVRLEFESEEDLARYMCWVLNPNFNDPRTRQYRSAMLVALNDRLIGLYPAVNYRVKPAVAAEFEAPPTK